MLAARYLVLAVVWLGVLNAVNQFIDLNVALSIACVTFLRYVSPSSNKLAQVQVHAATRTTH